MTLTGPSENKGMMSDCLEKSLEAIKSGNDSKDYVVAYCATELGHTGDYVWRTLKLWIALDVLDLSNGRFSIGSKYLKGNKKKKLDDGELPTDERGNHIRESGGES